MWQHVAIVHKVFAITHTPSPCESTSCLVAMMTVSRAGYTFSVVDAVQGHHVYKESWTPVIGEVLCCEREIGNWYDPQTVAVKKSEEIVGHVSSRISSICSSFLHHGGSIICTITGHMQTLCC